MNPQTTEPWVVWHSGRQMWMVRIRLRGHVAHVGYAATLSAAVALRNAWCARYLGGIARALSLRRPCRRGVDPGVEMASALADIVPTTEPPISPITPPPGAPPIERSLVEELEKELLDDKV